MVFRWPDENVHFTTVGSGDAQSMLFLGSYSFNYILNWHRTRDSVAKFNYEKSECFEGNEIQAKRNKK